MATVILNNRHSLQGLNLEQLIIKIRDGTCLHVDELASFQEGKTLADLSIEEFKTAFQDNLLSEETLDAVLKMADRVVNLDNCRLAVHEAICFANEFGQPMDQQLHESSASGSKDDVETEYQPQMESSKPTRKVEDLEKSARDNVQCLQLKTDLKMSTRTSLIDAVRNNDLLTVNSLIQSGTCDINIQACNGYTPLHIALWKSMPWDININNTAVEIVNSLIQSGTCDVNIQDSSGNTPLHIALKEIVQYYWGININNSAVEIVKCLLQLSTCDVNIRDSNGNTPLHIAIKKSVRYYWDIKSSNNALEIVKCLINHTTCDVNIRDSNGNTPLHIAIEKSMERDWDIDINDNAVKIAMCLIENSNCNVNIQNSGGDTPLHIAYNITIVRWLIDRTDCDVNIQNRFKQTPLHIAVLFRNEEIARFLIENTTCDVNLQDSRDNTPLHLAVEDDMGIGDEDEIGIASYVIQIVRCLLDQTECDVNIKNQDGNSPFSTMKGLQTLYTMAKCQNVELCHYFIQHNVDVLTNHVDNQLQLVKYILSENDFISLRFFIQNGLYINSLTSSSENILHLLAMFYSYIDFSFLIDYGLDFNLINNGGNSPLMVASLLNNSPFIQFISVLHCDVNSQNRQGHTALHLCVIGFTLIKDKLNLKEIDLIVKKLCANEYYPRYLSCIDALLNLGADVNIQDRGGKTVLMLACMKNDRKLLKILLIHGADVNIVDNHGRSALQYIDLTNNVYDLTCFNLLLSHGCRQSFNQPCLNCNTIIQNVLQFTPLWQIDDIVNFIKFLVFKNVNLQLLTSDDGEISYGQLCLEEFSSESRHELRQILYLSGGSLVQITQILHFEVEESYEASLPEPLREKPREKLYLFANNLSLKEICRRVIRQNTGLAIHDQISEIQDFPILSDLLMFQDIDSERLSLPVQLESFIDDEYDDDYNSYDLNKENDDYENDYLVYIDCKYFNFEKRDGFTPLHRAVEEGNIAKARYIIGLIHCDVNMQDHDDYTPLHIAVRDGDIDIARCLLEHTACDVNIQDSDDNTPLHAAVEKGDIDIVRCLLDQVDCNVNIQNNTGDTPLHIAVWRNDIEIVRCILAKIDCDVNIQDSNGYAPLHIAVFENSAVEEGTIDNNTTIASYLLEHTSCIIPNSDIYRYTRKSLEMGYTEIINCIPKFALKFPPLWTIDETINIIKFLVFINANLQSLTSNNRETYGQLSLTEFSSESRHELRQILYLSGGSFEQITQILHFDLEENYEASLPESSRETPREKFYFFANNLSLKEICRRVSDKIQVLQFRAEFQNV